MVPPQSRVESECLRFSSHISPPPAVSPHSSNKSRSPEHICLQPDLQSRYTHCNHRSAQIRPPPPTPPHLEATHRPVSPVVVLHASLGKLTILKRASGIMKVSFLIIILQTHYGPNILAITEGNGVICISNFI